MTPPSAAPEAAAAADSEKRPRPTLEFTLSTACVGLANLVADPARRGLLSVLATPFAFGLAIALRAGYTQFQHWRLERLIAEWERHGLAELARPDTTPQRAADIKADIAKSRKLLRKKQLDNLGVTVG